MAPLFEALDASPALPSAHRDGFTSRGAKGKAIGMPLCAVGLMGRHVTTYLMPVMVANPTTAAKRLIIFTTKRLSYISYLTA
jgi:hypothetical protein